MLASSKYWFAISFLLEPNYGPDLMLPLKRCSFYKNWHLITPEPL